MAEDRIKPLVFTIDETGDRYELDFNRETAKWAENRGVKVSNPKDLDTATVQELFFSAFRKNHKRIAKVETDRIIDEEFGKLPLEVVARLLDLLTQAGLGSVIDFENAGKNSKVTVEM